jgi:hypothetical protein
VRSRTFKHALRQHSAGRLCWLRRLHRSHTPQSGPFSTCMHRTDAITVCYTEVAVSSCHAGMTYHDGSPCAKRNGEAFNSASVTAQQTTVQNLLRSDTTCQFLGPFESPGAT